LEDNIGDGLRPPGGGDRGRELAAADLGFEGFLGEGWGRCTGLRGEGRAGARGGQTHRSPDHRGKNGRGNADVRGGGGERTGDRQNDVPSFYRKFILFSSRDRDYMTMGSRSLFT
jgi:hypothetical protein